MKSGWYTSLTHQLYHRAHPSHSIILVCAAILQLLHVQLFLSSSSNKTRNNISLVLWFMLSYIYVIIKEPFGMSFHLSCSEQAMLKPLCSSRRYPPKESKKMTFQVGGEGGRGGGTNVL